MKITLNRIDDAFQFEAKDEQDNRVVLDNKSKGISPMALLLVGVAGCSAMDIVSILQKQKQKIDTYKTEVIGIREDNPRPPSLFTNLSVKVILEGEIQVEKFKRAAKLSFDTYCSVSKTLERAQAKIKYELYLNGKKL